MTVPGLEASFIRHSLALKPVELSERVRGPRPRPKAAASSRQLQFRVVSWQLFRGRNQSPSLAEMERGHGRRLDLAQLGHELDLALPGWILGRDPRHTVGGCFL